MIYLQNEMNFLKFGIMIKQKNGIDIYVDFYIKYQNRCIE